MKTSLTPFMARAFLSLAGFSLTGWAALAAEGSAVARVGGTEIRSSEIRGEFEGLESAQQAVLAKDPALLNQAVRSILVRRMVLKEALAKNWQNGSEMARQLERLRENAIVESYLQSVSTPPADFPAEADLKRVYEENKAILLMPRQLQVSQIFIAAPAKGDKGAQEKAQNRLDAVSKKLKETPFAELAAAYNDEKNEAKEPAWIAESMLQPAIRDAVKTLAKGSVSQPIRMEDGWHIVKVADIREERTANFEEVREGLRQRLRMERQRAASMEYVNSLLKENPVSINELELAQLLQNSPKAQR